MKKVISYSLWCQEDSFDKGNINQTPEMYCTGALKNIYLKNEVYKDWTFRFYINDSVPKNIVDKILELKCEVINMSESNIPGMYWRFLPIQDNNVDVFIVRDIDSRISTREENAVNEWLNSDKTLHVMRDHPHHYHKILGGMWGFKNCNTDEQTINIRKNFNFLLDKFLKIKNYKFKRMDDMYFLDIIYENMKGNILGHDNFFNYPENKEFPDGKFEGEYYKFVGEIIDKNDIPSYLERDKKLFSNYKSIMVSHWSSKLWKK